MPHLENPFSSRFIRPGAIQYLLHGTESWDVLIRRFLGPCCGRAVVVGAHGSGKTTFLHAFLPRLGTLEKGFEWKESLADSFAIPHETDPQWLLGFDRKPYQIRAFRLSSNQRDPKVLWVDQDSWNCDTLLVVDGYEQLDWMSRIRLRRKVQRSGSAFLATSHQPLRLYPILLKTRVDGASIARVVREKLRSDALLAEEILQSQRFRDICDRWKDNLREIQFELYDWMEEMNGGTLARRDRAT